MMRPKAMSGGEIPVSRRAAALAQSEMRTATKDEIVLAVVGPDGDEHGFDRDSLRVVGRLVLAGIAARIDLPVSVIESLQLALDAVLRRQAGDGIVTVAFARGEEELTFRVGPLLLLLPDRHRLERTLQASADDVVWEDSPRGAWVSARIARRVSDQTAR